MMKVTFEKAERLAPTIETFWFKPEKPVDYVPGQFIELYLPHKQVDERGEKHWFTLSSSPTDKLLAITTKFAERSSSFKGAMRALEPGTVVDMAEPMGDFVLPKDASIPLVFVAGGMGITPFHSMFKWLAETDQTRNIKFIYAVRSEDDIIFQDTYDKAGIHATIIVHEPSDAWGGERGIITGEKILKLSEASEDSLIYLTGPEPMIESLQDQLLALKVPKRRLVTDFFPNYEPV